MISRRSAPVFATCRDTHDSAGPKSKRICSTDCRLALRLARARASRPSRHHISFLHVRQGQFASFLRSERVKYRRSTIASKLFAPELRLPEQDGAKLLDLSVPPGNGQDVERAMRRRTASRVALSGGPSGPNRRGAAGFRNRNGLAKASAIGPHSFNRAHSVLSYRWSAHVSLPVSAPPFAP